MWALPGFGATANCPLMLGGDADFVKRDGEQYLKVLMVFLKYHFNLELNNRDRKS